MSAQVLEANPALGEDVHEIEDVQAHPQLGRNALALAHGIRSCAGAALRSRSGAPIGALCALDVAPRSLDDVQRRQLRLLARSAEAAMDSLRDPQLRRLRDTGVLDLDWCGLTKRRGAAALSRPVSPPTTPSPHLAANLVVAPTHCLGPNTPPGTHPNPRSADDASFYDVDGAPASAAPPLPEDLETLQSIMFPPSRGGAPHELPLTEFEARCQRELKSYKCARGRPGARPTPAALRTPAHPAPEPPLPNYPLPVRIRVRAKKRILDTDTNDAAFDDITHAAATVCDCPVGVVSLIDYETRRGFFKSTCGCVGGGWGGWATAASGAHPSIQRMHRSRAVGVG